MSEISNNIDKNRLLTREEEQELGKRMVNGDIEARNILIESNLRLVASIAKQFSSSMQEFEELLQEGYLILTEEVTKFDYRQGYKFSTFITPRLIGKIYSAKRKQAQFVQIPEYLQHNTNEKTKFCEKRKEEASRFLQMLSLNKKITEGEIEEIADYLADEKDLEEETTTQIFYEKFLKLIEQNLPEEDYNFLSKRFGIMDGNPKTLEELTKEMGYTKESARQIEGNILKNLRSKKEIKGYNPKITENRFYLEYIHPNITWDLFQKFLNFFSKSDQEFYCNHRGIDVQTKVIKKIDTKKKEAEEKRLVFIEQTLIAIANKYYSLKNNLTEEEKIKRTTKFIKDKSLNMHYNQYSYPEVCNTINCLSKSFRKKVISIFGKDLQNIPEKSQNYSLKKAYETLDILFSYQNSNLLAALLFEYPKIPVAIWYKWLKNLSLQRKEILYLKHGKNLVENHYLKTEEDLKEYLKIIKILTNKAENYYASLKETKQEKLLEERIQLCKAKIYERLATKYKEQVNSITLIAFINKTEIVEYENIEEYIFQLEQKIDNSLNEEDEETKRILA